LHISGVLGISGNMKKESKAREVANSSNAPQSAPPFISETRHGVFVTKLTAYLGPSSIVVVVVTLILFILALFTKGLTHDILLEAGVFLVSVKLILMAYHNAEATRSLHRKLDSILTEHEKTKESCLKQ